MLNLGDLLWSQTASRTEHWGGGGTAGQTWPLYCHFLSFMEVLQGKSCNIWNRCSDACLHRLCWGANCAGGGKEDEGLRDHPEQEFKPNQTAELKHQACDLCHCLPLSHPHVCTFVSFCLLVLFGTLEQWPACAESRCVQIIFNTHIRRKQLTCKFHSTTVF